MEVPFPFPTTPNKIFENRIDNNDNKNDNDDNDENDSCDNDENDNMNENINSTEKLLAKATTYARKYSLCSFNEYIDNTGIYYYI